MIWGDGAYVGIGWDGHGFASVIYDLATPLDDEDANVMAIPANVQRIESLRHYQAQNAALAVVQEVDQIAAELRSPAGDALTAAAHAAYTVIAEETQAAYREGRAPDEGVVQQAMAGFGDNVTVLAGGDPELAARIQQSELPDKLAGNGSGWAWPVLAALYWFLS